LYGTEVDQVLVQENADGSLYWALSDHQGTVRDVVDGQGTVLNHIVYDSFGNVKSETNSGIDFRFGYTGRELDAETGLYYYRARYYDSQTGQFIGQDPLSFGAGDGNLYRYVFNNSTNFTDPSGKVVPVLAVIGLGIAVPIVVTMLVPQVVQAPTHPGDYHPPDPDQELKEAAVEVLLTGGASGAKVGVKKIGEELFEEAAERGAKEAAELANRELLKRIDDFARKNGGRLPIVNMGAQCLDNIGRQISKTNDELIKVGDDLKGKVDDTVELIKKNVGSSTNSSGALTKFDPKFAADQAVKNGRIHVDDLKKLVPDGIDDTFIPDGRIAEGSKFRYEVNGQKVEVKWHSPDSGAPIGSNSANGWTAQVKIKNKLLGQDGKLYKKPNNLTHIPVDF
jgi:RHS repeat-associated protein